MKSESISQIFGPKWPVTLLPSISTLSTPRSWQSRTFWAKEKISTAPGVPKLIKCKCKWRYQSNQQQNNKNKNRHKSVKSEPISQIFRPKWPESLLPSTNTLSTPRSGHSRTFWAKENLNSTRSSKAKNNNKQSKCEVYLLGPKINNNKWTA